MNFKRRSKLIVLAFLAIVLLVACGDGKNNLSDDVELDNQAIEEKVLEHELGETVLKSNPNRVVVFDYGMLDMMDNLGLEEKVVGLPKKTLPDYLSHYKSDDIEDIGSLQEPNFEKIFEIEPDLIIIGDRQAEKYQEFEELAPTLYISVMDGEYMDLLEENLTSLGKAFSLETEANKLFEDLNSRVEELYDLVSDRDKKSLFLMANDGEMTVYGKGSRFGVLFNEFGASPVDEEIDISTHGQKIGYEYIVEKDPDIIFVMDRAQIAGGDKSAKDLMENQLIHRTKAYMEDSIIYLDSPVWYVASGGITSTERMILDIKKGFE